MNICRNLVFTILLFHAISPIEASYRAATKRNKISMPKTVATPKPPTAKQTLLEPKTTPKSPSCRQTITVPLAQEIQNATIPVNLKDIIKKNWGNLYLGYLTKSIGSEWFAHKEHEKSLIDKLWNELKTNPQTLADNPFCLYTPLHQDPASVQNFKLCMPEKGLEKKINIQQCHNNIADSYNALNVDYFADLATALDPQHFKQSVDLTQTQIGYATGHLRQAVNRLKDCCKISASNMQPKVEFTGDVRDLGVIVNVQNNSKQEFIITQNSTDGNSSMAVGIIQPGLNPVQLHTAALQTAPTQGGKIADTTAYFSISSATPGMQNSPIMTLKIQTGKQILDILQSLPYHQGNIFQMNGKPASTDHLINLNDWYLVLAHRLSTGQTKNIDQRIQVVNLSKITGPFLLTMQINPYTFDEADVELAAKENQSIKIGDSILQPSLVSLQSIESPNKQMPALPIILLPKYLDDMPNIHMYWMLQYTTYLAAATDFSFFGKDSFADTYAYFKGLEYFNRKDQNLLFIDRYALVPIGTSLYDASWLTASTLYETDMYTCNDIPQIYSAQDSHGNIVSNANKFYLINFEIIFNDKEALKISTEFFHKNGFAITYGEIYDKVGIFALPTEDMKSAVFANLENLSQNTYQLSWKNKNNDIVARHVFYMQEKITNAQLYFLSTMNNWIGSTIDSSFLENQDEPFKVTYEHNSENDKHILLAQKSTPLDKAKTIIPYIFSEYPFKNLYIEAYQELNISPYETFHIIENNILPSFLVSLTEQDWKNGIYLISELKEKQLILSFYDSTKKFLGQLAKTNDKNIQAYNIKSSSIKNPLIDIYISTGVLFKYAPN